MCPTRICYAVADGGEVEEWLLTVVFVGPMLRKLELLEGSDSAELRILQVQRSCYLVTR